MMDARAWEDANARYLSAALQWLRLRLNNVQKDDSEARGSRENRKARDDSPNEPVETLDHFVEREVSIEPGETFFPSLTILCESLNLSSFEKNVLLLCAAAEFDPGISALCAKSKSNFGLPHPTFALALSIFDEPAWDSFSPERPLRHWKLIEISQAGAEPLTMCALRADERVVGYLKGLNCLDERLTPYLTPAGYAGPASDLAASQRQVVGQIVENWMRPPEMGARPIVQLSGPDAISKQTVALHAAADTRLRLYRISCEAVPSQPADLEAFARLWRRENLLLPLALYLDAQEMDSEPQATAMRRLLARCDGFLLLAVRETLPRPGRASWTIEVSKPTQEEQKSAWEGVIGSEGSKVPGALSGQFSLNLSDISQIGQMAASETDSTDVSFSQKLWDACRVRVRPHLDALAQRLDPKATWDDIVLPDEETVLLYQVAAQVNQRSKVYNEWGFARRMNRGLGISALFAGESGTGKTMAAEVIANDLRLNLYRIDLSAVVSKYIGETEKNLRRLFDAAEDGGAILFFDEADALFGKRSEVKDSHDRYANIEVNYLLQRVEAYCGLAILATNMRSALDTAFTRRLRFIVNFPFPNLADRRRMWRKAFPSQTPVDDLDYDRLARVNLTGGSVHNAAINAAFLAAQAGRRVTMSMVLKAIRSELIKMDRAVNEADFRCLETTGEVA